MTRDPPERRALLNAERGCYFQGCVLADRLTKSELRSVARVRIAPAITSLLWTWGWIALAFAFYFWRPNFATALLGVVIISAQQHGLAVLMHEGAHRLLWPNRTWNDRLSDWLCAYPLLLDTAMYRKLHLPHHRHTWTERDPDLDLARHFPITRASFRRKLFRDLIGRTGAKSIYGLARIYAGLSPTGRTLEGRTLRSVLWTFATSRRGFLLAYLAMFTACTLAGHPEAFFILWMVPAFTGLWLLLRLRSIAEHAAIPDPADPLRNTRTTHASIFARFLLAPHHVNYHLEHHLYPFVPHYRLAQVHRILDGRGAFEHAEVAGNYRQVWRAASAATVEVEKNKATSFIPTASSRS